MSQTLLNLLITLYITYKNPVFSQNSFFKSTIDLVIQKSSECTFAVYIHVFTETQVVAHDRQIAGQEIRMTEMDLRFQMIETASYDGKLLWKIRDFTQRKRVGC